MNYKVLCQNNKFSFVSVLQEGFENSVEKESAVLLIRDEDGIFKILKEVYDYRKNLSNYVNEDEIYERLSGHPSFSHYYGTMDMGGRKFIKISFTYGQRLSDYCDPNNLLHPDDAFLVLSDISCKLNILLLSKILYLDLKPENIIISSTKAYLIDLGLSQFMTDSEQRGIISHPRYVAPETAASNQVNEKSVVFQLGILAQEIFSGKHPFDLSPDESRTMDWRKSINRHLPALKNKPVISDEFISRMLESDTAKRPTLSACNRYFSDEYSKNDYFPYIRRKGIKSSRDEYVLFPARMGIPHKGHIDYMSRILDLGYKLIISIQRSYTITDRDPIPKWLVMKMVARSLMNLGYSKEDFKFFLTPFYETDQELRMHFVMMPEKEKIVSVASSNADVHYLFKDMPILEQRHVFCTSANDKFKSKSWGELLRKSIKDGDYEIFRHFVANGVEEILSFEELRSKYGIPQIEFVPGVIKAIVNDQICAVVSKYSTPEESLIRRINEIHSLSLPRFCRRLGNDCKMIDPYCKDSVLELNGKKVFLSYGSTAFDGENEIIYYDLLNKEVI
jgi:serine/threonine protein kinase